MKLSLPSALHLSIHVLVISSFSWDASGKLRHQRHRNFTETQVLQIGGEGHRRVESGMSQQLLEDPMSVSASAGGGSSTGLLGCSNQDSDCLSPPPPTQKSLRRGRQARPNRNRNKCLQEREERQRFASLAKGSQESSEYIPTCRKDGSYAQVQCHLQMKSCWCVTRGGKPVQGSSVLLASSQDKRRPNCAKYLTNGKTPPKRRSSQGKANRKSCNYADRSRFNAALIKTFKSEYKRYKSITSSYFESREADDESVLSWKFEVLDRNRDGILHKNETLILKNLVKQQIQPRACAKNFISFCAKGDHRIVKREWIDCLRLPNIDTRPSPSHLHPSQLLKPGGSNSFVSGNEPYNPLRSGAGLTEHESSNCWTDRQSALASQSQMRNESVIIPECTLNGLYHKVQCAQGKTYCWCVEEESGTQIPNTIVVNSVPDCNKRYSKPMKGCAGQKKQKFLTDLLDSLMKKMTMSINEGRYRIPAEQKHMSVQEQSARWYFSQQLDLNNNGIFERPEWKKYRTEISKDKKLKLCGKKLPRHCDVNEDRKLTMSEWVDCLGVDLFTSKVSAGNAGSSHTRRPVHRSNGRRNGKNPFTDILKNR